jgi:DNA-binding transcriptional MocR family regulator
MCTVMSLARRKAVVDFVVKNNLTIIEDDAYRFLHPAAPPSFLDLAPTHTMHIESLSKPFNPLLKITFLALPKAFVNDMANMIRLTSSGSSTLLMAFAEHVIHSGILDELIRKKQSHAVMVKREVASILEELSYITHENSFHLWLTLPRKVKSADVSNSLGQAGILIPTGNDFETAESGAGSHHIRVALAAERNLTKLRGALMELRGLIP